MGFGTKDTILIFSESLYPQGGGAQLATYLYSKLLAESGFRVIVITNQFTGEEKSLIDGDLVVHRLPIPGDSRAQKYGTLARIDLLLSSAIRKLVMMSDVVYVPGYWYSAIALAKAADKPVITHMHDYNAICSMSTLFDLSRNSICYQSRCSARCVFAHERSKHTGMVNTGISVALNTLVWPVACKLINLSDALVCVSEAQRRLVLQVNPGLGERCSVIYNPLPDLPFEPVSGRDFAYLGGDSILKGFFVLLNALRSLSSPVRVHGTNLARLPSDVADAAKTVGMVLHHRLGEKMLTSEIFSQSMATIFPSIWYEPLPYVVSESLLRGKIIIASAIGGVPEQVAGCPGAFLFQPGNAQELAETITEVQSMSLEQVKETAAHSREVFMQKFSNKKCIDNFSSLIYELVS